MKAIKYITITLFAIVAILCGLLLGGCKESPHSYRNKDLDTVLNLVKDIKTISDQTILSQNQLDSMLLIQGKYQSCIKKRYDYEIKYLRTENDKYRILGNKYVDSANYYAKIGLKLTHKK